MPRAPLLTEDEIRDGLDSLPGWELHGGRLVKTYQLADFMDALRFVNRIAEPAEQLNHHPDVAIHWREVRLSLWTHAAGGITGRDLRLAEAIEELTRAG
jgi:4a-hydroxytetrahydrobiopterin dehydratase